MERKGESTLSLSNDSLCTHFFSRYLVKFFFSSLCWRHVLYIDIELFFFFWLFFAKLEVTMCWKKQFSLLYSFNSSILWLVFVFIHCSLLHSHRYFSSVVWWMIRVYRIIISIELLVHLTLYVARVYLCDATSSTILQTFIYHMCIKLVGKEE